MILKDIETELAVLRQKATSIRRHIEELHSKERMTNWDLCLASGLAMEEFDIIRSTNVLEQWDSLSTVARHKVLLENGVILLPSCRALLEKFFSDEEAVISIAA